jgi:FeS assembly SUF system protein
MKDKDLSDFLPDKSTSYFKEFEISNSNIAVSKEKVIEEIKKVTDPEIPVNLYDLGLIYKIEIDSHNNVSIEMTLTNPNCPVAGSMPKSVGVAVEKIPHLSSIKVGLVWYPKWDKSMMSEDAKLALDIF